MKGEKENLPSFVTNIKYEFDIEYLMQIKHIADHIVDLHEKGEQAKKDGRTKRKLSPHTIYFHIIEELHRRGHFL